MIIINPVFHTKIIKLIGNFKYYHEFNDSTKSFMIHIPKTAGMSIMKSIYNVEFSFHAYWYEFRKNDPKKFDSYFKFSIVRNPYDRCKSAYDYLKQGGGYINDGKERCKRDLYMSAKYVKKYNNFTDFVINGGLAFAVKNNADHFIPQHKLICNNMNHIMVDYVGRYERLNEDYLIIKNKINNKLCSDQLFFKNITLNKITNDEINSQVMDIVYKIYLNDYKIFNYQ